ncbi:lysophosphatidylserine lipase ABHD12 isoform X2 [Aethina tumida]|uniref:lysophosphatidylserine lipase ABHD12 isoform X2 n=1 Tax=Aethina tumida TaxID=116153 RepID=UPI00096AF2F5|nr:lysophosphatidylserine lipase ABHD12 isoform X2 [Aethina tumida]
MVHVCCWGWRGRNGKGAYKPGVHVEDGDKGRKSTFRRSLCLKVTFATFQLILAIFLIIFIVIPLIYKFSYSLQRAAVFLNFRNIPGNADYQDPSKYGLFGARNLYVTTDEKVKLGVWHILPENEANDTSQDFDQALVNAENVLLYNHGNGGCRLTDHRVQLYKVLRKQFHVIAFDYRNYGDSSEEELTEDGVVRDVMFMIKWIKSKTKGHVFVWGHSLGTSLSTHALARLQTQGITVTGLILESPFNNMKEEISEFPLASWFRGLPWFSFTVIEPMQQNNFVFKTDVHICHVDLPVIILHAEDDRVVPYKLGYKLYRAAKQCKSERVGSIEFHTFEAKRNYGHKYIYKDEDLSDIIGGFVKKAISETTRKNLNNVD